MKRLVVVLLVLLGAGMGQDKPQAQSQPCVIVKRHVHKFGENMSRFHAHRPFDYVEGNYPSDFKWRSELSDGDVRQLQQKGGKIVVMSPDYQLSDLEDARKQCQRSEPSPKKRTPQRLGSRSTA